MANKILEEIFEDIVTETVKRLGIQCTPYIEYGNLAGHTPMGAVYDYQSYGLTAYSQFIVSTTTDGKIIVDEKNLARKQRQYALIATCKRGAVDYTICALRHELYHIHQAESGGYNGLSLYHLAGIGMPHGEIVTERKANKYMVQQVDTISMGHIATSIQMEEELPTCPAYDVQESMRYLKQIGNVCKQYWNVTRHYNAILKRI